MREKSRRLDKGALWLLVGVFCLMLSVTTLLTTYNHNRPTIHSDGEGYYLYLPATIIYHDLTMRWTQPLRTTKPVVLTPDPSSDGLHLYRPKVYLNKYPIGLAILWLPFFLAAHTITLLTGHIANGFSIWYQASIGLAAAVYGSLGCLMIYKLLKQYVSARLSFFTVLTLLLGTNFLSYATYDPAFTHIYSLFLIATLLYVTPRWFRQPTYCMSLLLAAVYTLNVLVRPTNILLMIALLLWDVTSRTAMRHRIVWLWEQRRQLVWMAAVGLGLVLPQLLYWHYITGHWLIFSYKGEGFNFLHPQLYNILFSANRGVFFWAPVLLPALAGLLLLRRYLRQWSTSLYVFLPVWLWVISSWYSWTFGASYGHRAFIDIFPVLALPIALFYSRLQRPASRRAMVIFACAAIFVSLFLTYQFWIQGVSGENTTLHGYILVWWYGLHSLFNGGLQFGFLGLLALVYITLSPATYYFLMLRTPRKRRMA